MLIPIIKDFNNGFSYLVSTSSEKAKEMLLSQSLPAISDPNSYNSSNQNPLAISWTILKIGFCYLINSVKYFISFQWLRDFSYLPISIPTTFHYESLNNSFFQSSNVTDNGLVQKIINSPNILQRYLFSNQTLTTSNIKENLPYQDFLLGSSHNGNPLHSWSLSFLSNDWFDPLTVPVNFLSSNNLSQLSLHGLAEKQPSSLLMESNFLQNANNSSVSHRIIMIILICIGTGFSSFFNSFFIGFPFSLSTILSLRVLIIQKFLAGCLSVLGIVCGEMTFMVFLILPPPFIQISLVYLESVWPYIFGLCLIIFILNDILSNPYNYSLSLSQTPPIITPQTKPKLQSLSLPVDEQPNYTSQKSSTVDSFQSIFQSIKRICRPRFLNNFILNVSHISPLYMKIFVLSFLLSLTEESCYFSFFGSLNLSSTANFIDTYLFAASQSPLILLFSLLGFVVGSFLAIIIYNIIIAKFIFLFIHTGTYYFNNLKKFGNNSNNFQISPIFSSFSAIKKDPKNIFLGFYKVFLYFYNNIKYLTISFFRNFLPGGKRIFSFSNSKKIYANQKNTNVAKNYDQVNNQKPMLETPSRFAREKPTSGDSPVAKLQVNRRALPEGLTNSFLLSLETSVENSFHNTNFNLDSASTNRWSENSASKFPPNETMGKSSSFTIGGIPSLRLYNKIDKILLTCLITLSFTTIPYYSFDYLVNSIFGFIPQDQILNNYSLRVNFPDYTNLLGISLSDKNSVINTDVSLYDRAHFMYGEWPNSFESLNYQGEFMWTNLRDHRRQKRTRRSTRLKFKTLKTKISTSWKEFKRGSGFSGSQPIDSRTSLPPSSQGRDSTDSLRPNKISLDASLESKRSAKPEEPFIAKGEKTKFAEFSTKSDIKSSSINQAFDSLTNRRNARYFVQSNSGISLSPSENKSYGLYPNKEKALNIFSNNKAQEKPETQHYDENKGRGLESLLKNQRVARFAETIQPLSTSSFIDLSGGEKYIKTYPKNWKKAIIEKYYQNPIYKTLLSSDLKPFLKREPKSQQLTNRQENECYFLRIKMAHYYDSLRFYFSLKNSNSMKTRLSIPSIPKDKEKHQAMLKDSSIVAPEEKQQAVFKNQNNSYPLPPFQFKSMTSMNYRQQFKGTLKTVKQLFAISLHNNYYTPNNNQNFDPMETFYKYDKYLFNEHSYSTNAFLHEEAKRRKKTAPSTQSPSVGFRKTLSEIQNNTSGGNKISSATKSIINMFGSNDPFYVGWDQNLRKFVLTSRILPRASALNRQTLPLTKKQNDKYQSKTLPKEAWSEQSPSISPELGFPPSRNLEGKDSTDRLRLNSLSSSKENSRTFPFIENKRKHQLRGREILENNQKNYPQKSMVYYRPYTCWPFFKHQLKNLPNRSYLVLYENYLNILNKRIHLFQNINSNDIDTKSLTFLYSYSFKNNVKKYVSQLPINIYKQAMRPSSLENLFTPVSNARSSFLWPGAVMPAWEYAFTSKNFNN